MKKADAILYFGSKAAVANAAGVSPAAVSQWGRYVPPATAAILEKKSGGKLKFDPDIYRKPGARRIPKEHRQPAIPHEIASV